MTANPAVDAILNDATQWRAAFTRLRKIARSFPLTEEVKWERQRVRRLASS